MTSTLSLYQALSRYPLGRAAFSRGLCIKAPYFASIQPQVTALSASHCEVTMRKRRAVTNHIGTVHAIAMCNMAELCGGLLAEASVPASHRWIPRGMTVEYLKKAETDLCARARILAVPDWLGAGECPVQVDVTDAAGDCVFRAVITMWVSPKK